MFVAFLSLKSFVIEYDFLGLKSICSRLQSCFYNMQSILAILVSFSRPMRSSTADTQITTINEQHGGLKTTKFENCGKITLQLARSVVKYTFLQSNSKEFSHFLRKAKKDQNSKN